MRENKGFFVACCLISLTWLYASYDADHSNSLFAMLLVWVGTWSWLGLLVLGAYRIVKRSHLPWKKRFAPLWLLIIPPAIASSYGLAITLVNAPTWLKIESYDFTGSDTMVFKKDGEYQYYRNSPIGRSAVIRGHYARHDSLLIMKPTTEVTMQPVARMAIRPYFQFRHHENSPVRLVALDSTGSRLRAFRIIERND